MLHLSTQKKLRVYQPKVEEIIAEGETVMLWGTDRATHTGPWRNVPATHMQVSFRVFVCAHFAHGKVVEYRFLNDELSLLQQVGALLPSG